MNFGEQWCCSSEPCHGLGNKSFPGKDLFTGIRGLVENRAYGGGGETVFSGGADCSAGTVLHLRQPCHGKCNDINRGFVDLYRNYVPCSHPNYKNNISQCIRAADKNDNLFTCLNRADENPFPSTNVHETTLDALDLDELLTSCTTEGKGPFQGAPGLLCPSVYLDFDNTSCLPFVDWCRGFPSIEHYCKFKNNEFLSTDVRVCSNATFWQKHPCGPGH